MATVSIENVSKDYGNNVRAVNDVSLDIEDGQFIVLVGPSGCGKSTLLRMVAGLETITDGEISIGDRVVNNVDPAKRDIAMVFQNYALYPHMTVRRNMAYGLTNRKMDKAEIERRVSEAASILRLSDYLERKPRQLSGGQRQRVAMGRAIVRDPAAFLFDEPLSNLDAKLRVDMRGEIKQLQRRLGTTSIYVTHDQMEAMTLADRLVVLNEGRIEQVGSPLELFNKPASLFVASFIGSPEMNLFDAKGTGNGAVRWGDADIKHDLKMPLDGAVKLGVRPHDLVPAKGKTTPSHGELVVTHVEELGVERLVHGTVAGEKCTLVVPAGYEVAETVSVHLPKKALHIFDNKDGKRL
ncbi:MAG: sn-glycerol-3-phosphate ABC transporter ATP-binding protein UgpC [Pseudomonadota bacterium]